MNYENYWQVCYNSMINSNNMYTRSFFVQFISWWNISQLYKGLSIFSTHNYFFYVRFLIRYLCALCDPLFLPQLKIRICLKHIVEYYFAQNWGWILESCSKVVLFCLNTVFQSAFFQGFKYYSVRQTIFYKCVLLELFLVSKYKGQT